MCGMDWRIWRRRPDLNRGSRFCRPLPYHLATAPVGTVCREIPAASRRSDNSARNSGSEPSSSRSEGWSGKRDSNPRLRPWQGRTLPLSYSRSLRKSSVTQRYLRDQEKADLKVRLYICLVGAVLRVRGRRGLRTRVAKNLRRLFGRSRIQI